MRALLIVLALVSGSFTVPCTAWADQVVEEEPAEELTPAEEEQITIEFTMTPAEEAEAQQTAEEEGEIDNEPERASEDNPPGNVAGPTSAESPRVGSGRPTGARPTKGYRSHARRRHTHQVRKWQKGIRWRRHWG